MQNVARLFPFLQWPRLDASLLRSEVTSGLTVAVVVIPQSVAYAGLAGMPLVTGLYAAFLPALIAVMFSRSTRLSVGPSALSCVLVGASIVGMAQPGSAQWVELVVWLAVLAGLIQLGLGAAGASWVLNLVSSPVLTGFSQAAALLIIASQLPALLGLSGPLTGLLHGAQVDGVALAYGAASLALFYLGRRYLPRVPMVLLVLGAAGALSKWSGYAQNHAVIGAVPVGFPSFYWPALPEWHTLSGLLVPAVAIALVSSLELATSAKIESQRDGKRWDANQDLIGQGIGKLTSAFSGSFPTSTSFSRSALTLYSGARTAWSTVFATGVVMLVLLYLTPALYHVPQTVLAAIVIMAVWNLLNLGTLARLWRIDRIEAITAAVTFAVTMIAAPRIYWGVLAGVVMGLAHFLYLRLHPRIVELGLHSDGSLRDRHLWKLAPLGTDLYALRMDAELDFASANALERAVIEHLANHPRTRHVWLFAQPINRVDATGVEVFSQLRLTLAGHQIALHLVGMKNPVQQVLEKAGALEASPLVHMYRTDAEALAMLDTGSAIVNN